MLLRLLFAVALISTPAAARDISLKLSDLQQTELVQLLEIATKAGGFSPVPATGRPVSAAALDYANIISVLRSQPEQPEVKPEPPK